MKLIEPDKHAIDINTFFYDYNFDDYEHFIILEGVFTEFNTRNGNNGRIYPHHVLLEHLENLTNNINNLETL